MKVRFDPQTDTLVIQLREGQIAESDESRPGVILDLNEAGEVISIEILDASTRVETPEAVEYRKAS